MPVSFPSCDAERAALCGMSGTASADPGYFACGEAVFRGRPARQDTTFEEGLGQAMLTKCKIAFVCLAIMMIALGCESTKTKLEARKQAILERKAGIEAELDALNDVFALQWKDVNIQDDQFLRTMLSLEADDTTLYATTGNGLLFLIDFSRGRMRATYDAGSSAPITPPVVRGSYIDKNYLYLVHDNSIHAVADPGGEGYLRAAWVKKHDGIIVTPLCDTERMLFFGDRDQRVYALIKGLTADACEIRMIDHLEDRIEIAPVTEKRIDRPYFLDASGDLYRFTGLYGIMIKPLLPPLGPIDIPALVDEQSETLLIASSDYKLHAVDARDGRRVKWTRELGAKPVGTMYIYNRAVYVINENAQLLAFQLDDTQTATSGKPLWDGNKVLDVKKIVSQGQGNSLYVLRAGNRVAKLDTTNGNILWERQLPEVEFIVVNRYGPAIYLGIKEGYIWSLLPR